MSLFFTYPEKLNFSFLGSSYLQYKKIIFYVFSKKNLESILNVIRHCLIKYFFVKYTYFYFASSFIRPNKFSSSLYSYFLKNSVMQFSKRCFETKSTFWTVKFYYPPTLANNYFYNSHTRSN